jgi:cyclase
MKNKAYIIAIILLTLLMVIGLAVWKPAPKVDKFKLSSDIDTDIVIKRPVPSVLVVALGYDAVTAIKTSNGIVMIDAGISTQLTSKYRKIIEKEFGTSLFAYLINTHSHPDHTGGNPVFSDAKIVGQENIIHETREYSQDQDRDKYNLLKIIEDFDTEMSTLSPGTSDWKEVYFQKVRYESAYNDIIKDKVSPGWDITFADSLTLNAGDATFLLYSPGRAHCESDIFILVPELKVLMTGDLFFPGGRPSIGNDGKPDFHGMNKAIGWLKRHWDDIDCVIGGHGQLMTRDDLEAFIQKIKQLQDN